MGIKGLTKLLSDYAPGCMREQKFEGFLDRKVAIDASMHNLPVHDGRRTKR